MGESRRVTVAELEQRLGPDGIAALVEINRQVVKRVGDTVLRWRVSWGVEDMIMLIVMHTCIVVSKQIGVRELLEAERAKGGEPCPGN